MPSSGARSGTRPSRRERGAGDGRVGPTRMRCGCELNSPEEVSRYPGGKRIYRCPEHGLVEKAR